MAISQSNLKLIQRAALACQQSYLASDLPLLTNLEADKHQWFLGSGPDGNVAAVLLQRPEQRILSFQGTTLPSRSSMDQNVRFLRDWIDNFRFALKRHQLGLPGKTHQGFARQLSILWPQLEPVLKQSSVPILVTGHSQGGAIAVLATKLLELNGYRIDKTITFGAPRTADDEFVSTINTHVIRVEHDNDIVPFVPPRISPINRSMAETMTMAMPEMFRELVKKLLAAGVESGLEYRPVGDLIYLRPGKPWITALSDWEQMQRIMRMVIAGRELIDDHWIESYVHEVFQSNTP